MYNLLIKLMVLTALSQPGISISQFESCHSQKAARKIENRARTVLSFDWKPISVFPEEAKRFR